MGNCCQADNADKITESNMVALQMTVEFENSQQLETYLKSDDAHTFIVKHYEQLDQSVINQIKIKEITKKETDISINDLIDAAKNIFQSLNIWYKVVNNKEYNLFWDKYQIKLGNIIEQYNLQKEQFLLNEKINVFQYILEIVFLSYQILNSYKKGNENIEKWWGDYQQLENKIDNILKKCFFTQNIQTSIGVQCLNKAYVKSYLILKSKLEDNEEVSQFVNVQRTQAQRYDLSKSHSLCNSQSFQNSNFDSKQQNKIEDSKQDNKLNQSIQHEQQSKKQNEQESQKNYQPILDTDNYLTFKRNDQQNGINDIGSQQKQQQQIKSSLYSNNQNYERKQEDIDRDNAKYLQYQNVNAI